MNTVPPPPPSSTAPASIVMGTNDHRWCVSGWHVLETDGRNGVHFRWTTAEAVFRIQIPAGANELRLMVCGPAGLTGRPAGLSVCAGTRRLAHLPDAAPTDLWNIVSVPFSGSEKPQLDLTLRSEEKLPDGTFVPRTFTFDRFWKNGDHRELGLMIAAIRAVSS